MIYPRQGISQAASILFAATNSNQQQFPSIKDAPAWLGAPAPDGADWSLASWCRIGESVSAISMGSVRGFLLMVSVTVDDWSLHIHGIMPG